MRRCVPPHCVENRKHDEEVYAYTSLLCWKVKNDDVRRWVPPHAAFVLLSGDGVAVAVAMVMVV
jgi:hypothetical protein